MKRFFPWSSVEYSYKSGTSILQDRPLGFSTHF